MKRLTTAAGYAGVALVCVLLYGGLVLVSAMNNPEKVAPFLEKLQYVLKKFWPVIEKFIGS